MAVGAAVGASVGPKWFLREIAGLWESAHAAEELKAMSGSRVGVWKKLYLEAPYPAAGLQRMPPVAESAGNCRQCGRTGGWVGAQRAVASESA
jgi:hypothetical protein